MGILPFTVTPFGLFSFEILFKSVIELHIETMRQRLAARLLFIMPISLNKGG